MPLYGNQGMGQFGTSGFAGRDYPLGIRQQYPGSQNLMQATGMYTNLLAGPYSNAYQIAAAQAADPSAMEFQAATGAGGQGAFAQPGAATQDVGKLFAGQAGAQVAGQGARQKQQSDALKGLLDTFNAYGQDIYQTQSAANQLQEAKLRAQEQQQQAIIDLGIAAAAAATGNYGLALGAGMGAMSPGGPGPGSLANTANPFQPQPGSLYSSYFGSGSAAPAPSGIDPASIHPSTVDMFASAGYGP